MTKKDRIKRLEEENEELRESREKTSECVSDLEGQLKDATNAVTQYESQCQTLESQISEMSTQLQGLSNDLDEATSIKKDLQLEVDTLTSQVQVSHLQWSCRLTRSGGTETDPTAVPTGRREGDGAAQTTTRLAGGYTRREM